jgi:hypothetical protein
VCEGLSEEVHVHASVVVLLWVSILRRRRVYDIHESLIIFMIGTLHS